MSSKTHESKRVPKKNVYYATKALSSIHFIWSSLHIPSSFFLHRNIGNVSDDPRLLFKPPSIVQETTDKHAGSMVKWEASWVMNQQAWAGALGRSLHISGLCFLLQGHHRPVASPTAWRVMRTTKPLGSRGTLFSLPRGTSEHLPFLWASFPGLCPIHEVRRLFWEGTPS